MSSNMKKGLSLITSLAVAFVMCLGGMGIFATNVFAEEGDAAVQEPDLIVSYGNMVAEFFYDEEAGALCTQDGTAIAETEVSLYTAIKNTGSSDNVANAKGPKILSILKAAGIDYSKFKNQMITFVGNDGYDVSFKWGDLFSTKRYAFPKANRPGDPGDQGAAVKSAEKKGKKEVPVILNFNIDEDGPQVSFGQVSPSERNKPSWAKNMLGQGFDKQGNPCTAQIVIEDVASFDQLPNVTDENVNVPSGSKIVVGDDISFGGAEKESPYEGTIYYSTNGKDPAQSSAIYNWDTYKKDGFNYNPFIVKKVGKLTVKTVEYKYGFNKSKVKTFKYTVLPAMGAISKATAGKKKVTVKIVSQKASGVTKYQIAYKKTSDSKWKKVSSKSTKKTIKKLKKGVSYDFKVRAYGGKKSGYGQYSEVVSVTVK